MPENQPANDSMNPARLASLAEESERLIQIVAELPEAQREAFVLRQEAGMSIEEIAEATGVNRETAKSRLRYAMSKIRRALECE